MRPTQCRPVKRRFFSHRIDLRRESGVWTDFKMKDLYFLFLLTNIKKPPVHNRQLEISCLMIISKYETRIIIYLLLPGLSFLQMLGEMLKELRLVFLNASLN